MQIGIVTCKELPEPDHDQAHLEAALARTGIPFVMVPWDGPCLEPMPSTLVIRSCWNYHIDPVAFTGWLSSIPVETKVLNDLPTVRWNMDKSYLTGLAAEGVPIVPTRIVPRGSEDLLTAGERSTKVVVKPCVSCGSWMTRAFDPSDAEADAFLAGLVEGRDAMVQPYLSSVDQAGERSLVYIGGHFSHCVGKSPRFHDGEEAVSEKLDPGSDELDLAERVMAGRRDSLYARVDVMRSDEGLALLSELEMIEPSLFFSKHPAAADSFVRALLDRI